MKRHELDHYFGSAAEKIEVAGTYNLLYNSIFFIEAGGGRQCSLLQGHGGSHRSVPRAGFPAAGARAALGELGGLAQRSGLLLRRPSRRGGSGRGFSNHAS